MDDFEELLKRTFLEEANDLLEESEEYYMTLEENSDDMDILDAIFRNAHSFKGSSRAAGFEEIGRLTHRVESILLKIKEKEIDITSVIVSLLLKCNDALRNNLADLEVDLNATFEPDELIRKLEEFEAEASGKACKVLSDNDLEAAQQDSFSVPINGFHEFPENNVVEFKFADDIGQGSENTPEPLAGKSNSKTKATPKSKSKAISKKKVETKAETSNQQVTQAVSLGSVSDSATKSPVGLKGDSLNNSSAAKDGASANSITGEAAPIKVKHVQSETIRVGLDKIEGLIDQVGELVILQSVLQEHLKSSDSMILRKTMTQFGKIIKDVQGGSMGLRMVPIKSVFQKMQRIVRDTALELGKDVDLELVGEDVEVDKTVLDKVGDPLVHITRNAVDHGIELPDIRKDAGKSTKGKITLKAYHESGRLMITMEDDGKGIDPDLIRENAKKKGLLEGNEEISDQEAVELVMAAGFSTKTEVSDLSGRGVGMDVVKTNVTALSGGINISSEKGKGSKIHISLPLTLAIIDGMVIRSGDKKYVLPLAAVRESVSINKSNVKFLSGIGEVLLLRDDNLPMIDLYRTLGIGNSSREEENTIAIVVSSPTGTYAIVVDDILARAQVVIKQLGKEIRHIKGVSGSTILGDGLPALILEVPEIIESFKPLKKSANG